MDKTEKDLLVQIADLYDTPSGNYNIIKNGESISRASSQDVEIVSKKAKNGVDVVVKAGLKDKNIYLPTIVTACGNNEEIVNDIFVGKNADIVLTLGSGVDSDNCDQLTQESLVVIHIGENAKVKLVEKYFAEENTKSNTTLNVTTKIKSSKNSELNMESALLGGFSTLNRKTVVKLAENSKLNVKEEVTTSHDETIENIWDITFTKNNSEMNFVGNANASENSKQKTVLKIKANAKSKSNVSHSGEIKGKASIAVLPELNLNHPLAIIDFHTNMGNNKK